MTNRFQDVYRRILLKKKKIKNNVKELVNAHVHMAMRKKKKNNAHLVREVCC